MKASSIVTGSITPLRVTPWNSEQCANSWKTVLRTWWLHQCLNISSITLSCDTLTLAVFPPLPVSLRDDSGRITADYKSLNLFFSPVLFFPCCCYLLLQHIVYLSWLHGMCSYGEDPWAKCLPFLVATGLAIWPQSLEILVRLDGKILQNRTYNHLSSKIRVLLRYLSVIHRNGHFDDALHPDG